MGSCLSRKGYTEDDISNHMTKELPQRPGNSANNNTVPVAEPPPPERSRQTLRQVRERVPRNNARYDPEEAEPAPERFRQTPRQVRERVPRNNARYDPEEAEPAPERFRQTPRQVRERVARNNARYDPEEAESPSETSRQVDRQLRECLSLNIPGVNPDEGTVALLRDINKDDDIIIAVMGVTGAGKTTFIQAIVGNVAGSTIGHDLEAGTITVTAYQVPIPNTQSKLILVDTPGFDDPSRPDSQVLTIIADWMKKSYTEKKKLTGIIYLHRITDIRFDAGSSRTLTLFQRLFGSDDYTSVCFTTTKWNDVHPSKLREHREKEQNLIKGQWAVFFAKGAISKQFDSTSDTRATQSAKFAVYSLVVRSNEKLVLKIQREMVDEGKKIYRTQAGKFAFTLEERLSAQLTQMDTIMAAGH